MTITGRQSGLELLPPVVQLLLREPLGSLRSFDDFEKYLRRMFPELRRQAEWSVTNFEYLKDSHKPHVTDFVVCPSGGLDPFSSLGKCASPECRLRTAEQIARTVGVYSDVALIPDPFTYDIAFKSRWSTEEKFQLLVNIAVLRELRPLLEAGLFRLVSSIGDICNSCYQDFSSQVEKGADLILNELKEDVRIERIGDRVEICTEKLFDTPLIFHMPLKKSRTTSSGSLAKKAAARVFSSEICEALFTMRLAAANHATTFSNSRLALIAARLFEGDLPKLRDIDVWEASRSASLPWLSGLSMEQIIELRHEATRALPRFRERLATILSADSEARDVAEVIRELKADAAEVDAELQALDLRGEAIFHNIGGVLGLTISVYGFAAEFMSAGVALTSLASLLGLLHAGAHSDRREFGKVSGKPGYVLVKAKEILEHAPHPGT